MGDQLPQLPLILRLVGDICKEGNGEVVEEVEESSSRIEDGVGEQEDVGGGGVRWEAAIVAGQKGEKRLLKTGKVPKMIIKVSKVVFNGVLLDDDNNDRRGELINVRQGKACRKKEEFKIKKTPEKNFFSSKAKDLPQQITSVEYTERTTTFSRPIPTSITFKRTDFERWGYFRSRRK